MKHLNVTSPAELFAASMRETCVDTDRVFGWLMIVQWVVGVLLAIIDYSELMQLLAVKKKDTTYTADLEKINKALADADQ